MRVLIVGAGAVGLVYARHLQADGHDVTFFVREKYLADVAKGFTLYALNEGQQPVRLDGIPGIATLDAVRATDWDQVWLAIPTTGLYGDWLAPFMDAIGDALVVSFQPGLRVAELLGAHVPPERLAKGVIAFSSWPAPLPGSSRPEPGTAYWCPPLTPNLFEGPHAAEIAAALKRGGLPAKVGDADAQTTRGSAILLTMVSAMECGGWTFAGLRSAPWARLSADAGKQALAISCKHAGISAGPVGLLPHPLVQGALTCLAPVVAPFDIEKFFEVHFTKVGAQTELALDGWIDAGRSLSLPTDKLVELRAALLQARGRQP
ncbi:MAG: hypothetical protein H6742_03140 [Alphaproteobacteria bacterium]|nr:hypothetical protein [Alphaproteobacteria bacterium]